MYKYFIFHLQSYVVVILSNAAVHQLVSNPPKQQFLGNQSLNVAAVSKSEVPQTKPESPPVAIPKPQSESAAHLSPPLAGVGVGSSPTQGGISPNTSELHGRWATPVPQYPPRSPVMQHQAAGLHPHVPHHGEFCAQLYVCMIIYHMP